MNSATPLSPITTKGVVERTAPGIEVALIGGHRVRFERDVGPDTVRRLVELLESNAR